MYPMVLLCCAGDVIQTSTQLESLRVRIRETEKNNSREIAIKKMYSKPCQSQAESDRDKKSVQTEGPEGKKTQQKAHWGKLLFSFPHQGNCGVILFLEGERDRENQMQGVWSMLVPVDTQIRR